MSDIPIPPSAVSTDSPLGSAPAVRVDAVMAANWQRVAQAALERLTLDDHPATYAAWCDAQARAR